MVYVHLLFLFYPVQNEETEIPPDCPDRDRLSKRVAP